MSRRDHRLLTVLQAAVFSTLYVVLGVMNTVGWPVVIGIVVLFMSLGATGVVRETRKIRVREAQELTAKAEAVRENERKLLERAAAEDRYARRRASATWDRDVRQLTTLVEQGAISAAEARDRFTALRDALLRETRDRPAPAEQLKQLSSRYGLPVNVLTPVSAGGPLMHFCKGPDGHPRYYANARFCPEHRGQTECTAVTPVQKPVTLPVLAGPDLDDWNSPEDAVYDEPQVSADTYPGLNPAQIMLVQELKRRIAAAEDAPETRPEDLVPDAVTAADEAMAGYVPEGEPGMLEDLRRSLRGQWRDAAPGRAGRSVPFPGHWEMSPAWAEDTRKLRDLAGDPVWPRDIYTLYGYLVKIDIAYGAPVLKET